MSNYSEYMSNYGEYVNGVSGVHICQIIVNICEHMSNYSEYVNVCQIIVNM